MIQSCIRSVNVRVFIALGRLCCALVIWGNLHRQTADHVHLCVSHFDSWKRGGHPLRQLSDRLLLDVHSYLGMFIHTLTHESTHSQMNRHQNEVATQNMTAIGWGIIYSCVCVCDREIAKHSGKNWKLIYFLALTLLGFLSASQSSDISDFVTLPAGAETEVISHNPIKSWESICVRLCASYSTICGSDI